MKDTKSSASPTGKKPFSLPRWPAYQQTKADNRKSSILGVHADVCQNGAVGQVSKPDGIFPKLVPFRKGMMGRTVPSAF